MQIHSLLFLLLLSFILSAAACGNPTQNRELPLGSKTSPVSNPDQSTVSKTSPIPDTTSIPPNPLPTPRVYFGDLGRPNVTLPVSYSPLPNRSVLLIVIDALNARRLSVYGNARKTSPHLESLANNGLLLTNYIANSSWTRPSFTTIITGLTKQQHGVELNGNKLSEDITTVAERFRDAGYQTAAFMGNPLVREIWGFGQGFQTYEDTATYHKAFPPDSRLVDNAIRKLKKIGDKPFFMMLFLTSPHTPYRPPSEYREYLRSVKEGSVIDFPFQEYVKPVPKDEHDRIVAAYDGELAYVDAEVGRLLDYLKESSKINRTSVVVTADHGEMMGQHNCYVHSWHMWEQTLRVPFILSSPGLEKIRGMIDDRPFTHADIAPTLFHLAGINHVDPNHMGVSIVERLKDPTKGRSRMLFSQFNAHGIRRQAVRKGPLKLVHHHLVPKSSLKRLHSLHSDIPSADPKKLPSLALDKERYELYNLVNDPDENNNLFEKMSGTPELNELMSSLSSVISRPLKPAPTLSEETIEALTNAGYLVPSKER